MSAGPRRSGIGTVTDLYLTRPPVRGPRAASAPEPPDSARARVGPAGLRMHIPVSLVLPSALADEAGSAASEYARSVAADGHHVALLTLGPAYRSLRRFHVAPNGLPDAPRQPVGFQRDDAESDHEARSAPAELDPTHLHGLLGRADRLIIAWMGPAGHLPAELAGAVSSVTVLATAREAALIDAYRNIKLASDIGPNGRVGLFVIGGKDASEARHVTERLSDPAIRFLECDVALEGYSARTPVVAHRVVAESANAGGPDAESSAWLERLVAFVARHNEPRPGPDPREQRESASESTSMHSARNGMDRPTYRRVLPMSGPLRTVQQMDACVAADLASVDVANGRTECLDPDGPPGVSVRCVRPVSRPHTILACALDATLPVLETAIRAARSSDEVGELVLVTPPSDRYAGVDSYLSCPLRIYHFEPVRLGDHYGLLLSAAAVGS